MVDLKQEGSQPKTSFKSGKAKTSQEGCKVCHSTQTWKARPGNVKFDHKTVQEVAKGIIGD